MSISLLLLLFYQKNIIFAIRIAICIVSYSNESLLNTVK